MELRVLLITYALSNPRNISERGIRCSCKRCKNKNFLNPDVVTMHLLQKKKFLEKHRYWFVHEEPYVPYGTVIERMVGSTSSSSNVHGVVDQNNNSYKNMVIYEMRMNKSYAGECSIIDEEPNADTTRFFDLLKDSNKLLWDECTNHNKLSAIAHVFTIKSYHRLSEAGYDKIIE